MNHRVIISVIRGTPRSLRLCFFVGLVILGAPIHMAAEQTLDHWLETDPRAAMYQPHREQLLGVFLSAAERSIPSAPLVRTLREAAAKRAPFDIAYTALDRELERLYIGTAVLERSGLRLDADQRIEVLSNISLYLQSTLSPEVLLLVFEGRNSLEKATQAAAALVRIKQNTGLSDDRVQRLAAAIRRSELPVSAYRSLPAVFLQARSWGVPEAEAAEIIIRELQSGGGLVQINNALRRRRSR